ncbi:MAG TPA: hypothetical protein VGY97_07630 [Solirubrobacteraceae bacterium]|nr:hypothetical protein [Solirubrobacteraceae bacterium]
MTATDQRAATGERPSAATDERAATPEPLSGVVPLLFGKRVILSSGQAAQFTGTETELDMKPDAQQSDVNAKENIAPVDWEASAGPAEVFAPLLFGQRAPLSPLQAAQYAATETELDVKKSDANAKENISPVAWRTRDDGETRDQPTAIAEPPAGTIPLLFRRRVLLSSRQAAQFRGTETELDMKPDISDVHAKENIVRVAWEAEPAQPNRAAPMLFLRRAPLQRAQALQYAGTDTELDQKGGSDIDTKENIVPVSHRPVAPSRRASRGATIETARGRTPLLFRKRMPLARRQTTQYAGTDTELDTKLALVGLLPMWKALLTGRRTWPPSAGGEL